MQDQRIQITKSMAAFRSQWKCGRFIEVWITRWSVVRKDFLFWIHFTSQIIWSLIEMVICGFIFILACAQSLYHGAWFIFEQTNICYAKTRSSIVHKIIDLKRTWKYVDINRNKFLNMLNSFRFIWKFHHRERKKHKKKAIEPKTVE